MALEISVAPDTTAPREAIWTLTLQPRLRIVLAEAHTGDMDHDFQPTEEQQAILAHDPSRHARLLAGPGTGKSATTVALLDRLLAGKDAPRVRLLTFTRAATAELAEKVATHPVVAAERPSTVHSFAISVLLQNPGAGDFPQPLRIADDWERDNVVYPTLAQLAGVRKDRIDRLVREMAADWEALAPELDPKVDPADRSRFLGCWNEHRDVYGYTLLAELPHALLETLRNQTGIQGVDYDLIVVDEYQDLNACDLEVLRLLGERGASIIGAGDDDQSIYSFRKAAPEGIRRFLEDFPGASDYTLSVTQRCGSKIIEWANSVIQGDPHRPRDRQVLTSAPGSPDGETALLAFAGHAAEPLGIAQLVNHLIQDEQLAPSDILILLRADRYGHFSDPIKAQLAGLGIPCSDPDIVKRMLSEPSNRGLLESFRLVENSSDSLAWASLLCLTDGIGRSFTDSIYSRAQGSGKQFGQVLLEAHAEGFPGIATAPANKASALITGIMNWLSDHTQPDERPENGWGAWILESSGDETVPTASDELRNLLLELDELAEPDQKLGRYLGQIAPLGKDLAAAKGDGVRIMTMANAKGLTVKATIIAALEQGIVPMAECDTSEERRLLYVAMTRSKQYLYGTWARKRSGPTARSGRPQVQNMRRVSSFLQDGPVASTDGPAFIKARWKTTGQGTSR
jgi:DNA helicase II / ATP-dependent DNA helicase PcrA